MAIPSVSPSKTGLQPSAGYIDRCWTVPFITGFLCFLISIPQTNSGLLFVMFMDAFGVNRETAAWPKTIHTATTSLMGFALGAIQHKVSIHSTILAGALLCPVAIIASAFVPNVAWMSVTLGLLYGAGYGALVIGTAVYIVSYFHEYRGFAMGIKFLGVSLSGIAGPSLVSLLASEHGLKGCFLIMGGMMLHLIPLAFMLRYANPVTCKLCRRRKSPGQTVNGVSTKFYGTTMQIQATNGSTCSMKQPDFIACDDLERRNSLTISGTKSTMGFATNHSMCPAAPQEHRTAPLGFLREAIDVLRSPCFYVLLVAMVAADFTLPLYSSTIVDYAVDKGVAFNVAAQLVVYQCLGGFVGRLVLPLITDKLAHSRCPITAISLAALSLCFLVFPHITSLVAVAVVSFFTGVQQGYLNAFKSVLVAEYLGVHSVAVSWGFIGVATLPLVFCEPSIVGAFRDTRGSYDNLYRMCGAVNLFAAVLVSAQACLDVRKRRNNLQISPTT